MTRNYEYFLKANLDAYAGKWIAIVRQKVVAYGDDALTVYNLAKSKYPHERPSIAKVPKGETMILVVKWR
ncbi:MAG: succinyl-CoA synthetase subunit alpha [Candidatus Aenigmarchaeota archaeon]|nr:succinyl-CoA synthetase subunit alpha [Candidatus Aenigmarchaeota archaeon]